MRGPPLCVSQWGAGKNESMAKLFHVKITKSQPPHYGGWAKQRKRDLQLIKMNFGAKIFLKKVIFASPGPDLALKHPGVFRLEALQRLRRNYFVFCLNFRQVNQINQRYGPKRSF